MDEPSSPTPHAPDGPAAPTRRTFLTRLSQVFLGLWGVGIAGAIAAYLRPPSGETHAAERLVRVGHLDDLRVGEGILVRHGATPFFVVRRGPTDLIALSAVCTHLRCILTYDRDREQVICPCHHGRFNLAGDVLAGPPPRALPGYSVTVRAGEVFVQL